VRRFWMGLTLFGSDPSRYRTPYGRWGGFTNGYEGNLHEFLMKAQKALSGGSPTNAVNHIPASFTQPSRQGASPTTGYAPILPRPSTGNASASPALQVPISMASPAPGIQYQPNGVPIAPAGQGMMQPGQPTQHVWQAIPQPAKPAPAPKKAKKQPQPLAKQSTSPIPLPSYVLQMMTGASSGAPTAASAAGETKSQAQVPAGEQQPAPAAAGSAPATGESEPTAPVANDVSPEVPKKPEESQQQEQAAPPAAGLEEAVEPAADVAPKAAEDDASSALVQKMMINLRRASQNLGSVLAGEEEGQEANEGTAQVTEGELGQEPASS
jgi:hypothetical protein